MIQVHSANKPAQVEHALRCAVERRGGSVLAVTHFEELLRERASHDVEAIAYTVCFPDLYRAMLIADIRFAAFLPVRIAIHGKAKSTFVETVSPSEFCRTLRRPELEESVLPLEALLRTLMEDAARARPETRAAAEHNSTEDQVNMRLTLPQRIDCHGSKVEELAGTGALDTQGG